jgi:predicted ATPase
LQQNHLRQWLRDPWLAELSRLLPDLRERYPDLPPPTIDGAFASSRLFEALARLTQALAAQAPLLMFADDIRWTDAATLGVFQYLAHYWTEHGTPALLLLSRRTETRDMDPQMSEWLASLRNTLSLTRLELGPLSAKDILQIARSLSGVDGAQPSLQGDTPPRRRDKSGPYSQPSAQHVQAPESSLSPERFGAWLFAETKGQPFYLKALLQTLLERGVLVPSLIAGSRWVFEPHPRSSKSLHLTTYFPRTCAS